MAYLIGWIINSVVFGFITLYVAESKGYDGGFWWGFWLGIIGLLVVGFRPDNTEQHYSHTSSELPAWASSSSANLPSWTCVCGAKNSGSLDYCQACRRNKSESTVPKKICPHCGAGNKATNTLCFACDKPLDENHPTPQQTPTAVSSEETSSDYITTLEKLGKLREQGILTEEEFQQKKSEILAKM